MLNTKITVDVVHNTFDGLISRLDTAEERTSELEHMPIEIIQTETQGGKKGGNKSTEQPKFEGQHQMIYHVSTEIHRGKKRTGS